MAHGAVPGLQLRQAVQLCAVRVASHRRLFFKVTGTRTRRALAQSVRKEPPLPHRAAQARLPGVCAAAEQHQVASTAAAAAPPAAEAPAVSRSQAVPIGVVCSFLAYVLAALAAAQIWFPEQLVSRAVTAPAGALGPALLQMAGATMLLCVNVLWVLADAAQHNRLASETYRRLSLSAVAYFAMLMAAVAFAPQSALNRWYRGLLIALAPFAFAAAGSAWVLTAASRQPLPLLREAAAGAFASARKLLSPANTTSAAYCAGTAAVAVVGVSFLGLGGATREGMAGGLYLRRYLGAGLLLQAAVLYTLKDAADRGRLGASTFRRLNGTTWMVSLLLAAALYRACSAGALLFSTRACGLLGAVLWQLALTSYQLYPYAKDKVLEMQKP